MTLWQLHGLVVRCADVDLDARRAPAGAEPDVTFRLAPPGPVLAHGEEPDGRVMSTHDYGAGASLTVAAVDYPDSGGPRVEVHFHGLATAYIAADCSSVDLVLATGADRALAPVLLGGTIISTLLVVRGHPVLHASAVTVGTPRGEEAIAFVGHSGMGKSTMATLLCRDGARLLGDDVLRSDVRDDGTVVAWPGATATRLREAAADLGRDSTAETITTADGRLSARLEPAAPEAVMLRALVVPQPDRETDRLRLTRLHGAMAVLTLASFPRLLGWVDPATTKQAHEHWGALARAVPVFTAEVPWGPPFAPSLGSDVVRVLLEHT